MSYDWAIQSEHALIGVVLLAVAGAIYKLSTRLDAAVTKLAREVSLLRGQLEGAGLLPPTTVRDET